MSTVSQTWKEVSVITTTLIFDKYLKLIIPKLFWVGSKEKGTGDYV